MNQNFNHLEQFFLNELNNIETSFINIYIAKLLSDFNNPSYFFKERNNKLEKNYLYELWAEVQAIDDFASKNGKLKFIGDYSLFSYAVIRPKNGFLKDSYYESNAVRAYNELRVLNPNKALIFSILADNFKHISNNIKLLKIFT